MKTFVIGCFAVLLSLSSILRGQLLAYEGFAASVYTAGQLLNQNPTVSGFDGAWTPGSNIHAGGASAALTWPGMATTDTGGAFSNAVGNRAGRDLSPVMSGEGTYYLSVLMRNSAIDSAVNNYRALELWNFGNRNLQIGVNRDIDGTGLRWGMRAIDNNTFRVTTADAAANQTVLAVLKITFSNTNNGDSVRLWINPTDLSSEAASGNSVVLSGFNFTNNNINNFRFAAFSGSSTAYWDELRIGGTWADVLPAPVAPTFRVRYFGSGSTGGAAPVDATAYASGASVTVAGNSGSLLRTNDSFAGWNTAADGSGTAHAAGGSLSMGASDVNLYAQWTQIPPGEGFYEVLYDGNGHTAGTVPEDLNYYAASDTVTAAAVGNMARQGWAFSGWNTQADGEGTVVAAGGTFAMGAASVTLFAQWDLNPSTGKPVRVFVLAGQSNMRGLGRISQAPAEWRPLEGVLFDDTVPGTPGSFSAVWGVMAAVDDDLGPELGFAATLREAYPGETIAIVKVSQSGTGLGFWRNPGEGGHDTLMARIDLTRDWLNASLAANDIPSWQYGGFIWMQGENEANSIVSVAEAYENDFADLAQKVRTRTGVADLPVVLGRISIRLDPNAAYPGPVKQPQLDQVRAGQVSWAENDSNGGWVDTDDLPLIDSWHFGSAGQIRLGRRFAGAWFDLVESRPALRLRRAEGQPLRSSAPEIVYVAEFSRLVSGFTAADVEILGDTGAQRVVVSGLSPNDGSRYEIRVSGMFYSGVVDLRVGNGAALAEGELSLPGIADETAVLFAAHGAVDALLLHEPFEAPARPLHQLQSGFGWSGTGWEVQNSAVTSYATSEQSPLSYGNLWASPAYASGGDNYQTSARMLDLENTFAGYMTSRGAAAVDLPGTTLWLSYLIRPGNAGRQQRVSLLRGTGATYSDANNMVTVQQTSGTWRMTILNNAAVLDTGIAVVAGQTHFMVLRLHIGGVAGASSAHLWVDPAPAGLGGADLDLSSATVSHSVTSADFKFARIHWYPGGSANDGALDEVRLGTSYASVTPLRNTAIDPTVGAVSVTRPAGQEVKLSDLTLLANSTDPQASPLRVVWTPGLSDEGGLVQVSGRWTTYTPPVGEDPAEDQFVIRVQNALGGWADGVVTVTRLAPPDPGGSTLNLSGVTVQGNDLSFRIYGIPGRQFDLETTADLLNPDWRKIGEISIGEDGHALFVHTDAGPTQFYRSIRKED